MTTLTRALFLALLLTSTLAFAQGTYTQFDVPGSYGTQLYAIDSSGDVVGTYYDANSNNHGFLYSGGSYTTIDYPGGVDTTLTGLNDSGQIIGYVSTLSVGFVYDVATQTFTTIAYPGAVSTYPTSINDVGITVGWYGVNDHKIDSFELNGSVYTNISPKPQIQTLATAITQTGTVVGNLENRLGVKTFLLKGDAFHVFLIPNALGAIVEGANPGGTALVGNYEGPNGYTYGFLYQHYTLNTLQFPNSFYTYGAGINSAGEVVGYFEGQAGYHGFIWTPPAPKESKQ